MTFLIIDNEPIELLVTIGGEDFDLGTFDSIRDAARAGGKWVRDRGLAFAPDTYARLADAKAREAAVLTLDVIKGRGWSMGDRSQAWHHADYYPYIHIAHRMGL